MNHAHNGHTFWKHKNTVNYNHYRVILYKFDKNMIYWIYLQCFCKYWEIQTIVACNNLKEISTLFQSERKMGDSTIILIPWSIMRSTMHTAHPFIYFTTDETTTAVNLTNIQGMPHALQQAACNFTKGSMYTSERGYSQLQEKDRWGFHSYKEETFKYLKVIVFLFSWGGF